MLFATFAIVTIYVLKYGNCNIPSIITPVMLICKFLIATDSEKRKTVTAALFKSVFFRLHQICTRQTRENHNFLLNFELLWNFHSKFLLKNEIIVLYILKYFREHWRKGRIQNQLNYGWFHFLLSFENFSS